MLIPLPPMPTPGGPTPSSLRSKSPFVLAVLIVQSVLCLLRMVLLLDILGGFMVAICIGLGWYGWHQDMHITFLCYWGFMGLVNGMFDCVLLVDTLVKSKAPLLSSQASGLHNAAGAVRLLSPAAQLAGAGLAWGLYREVRQLGVPSPAAGGRAPAPWAAERGEGGPLMGGSARPRPGGAGFQTFGGQGQRLGAA